MHREGTIRRFDVDRGFCFLHCPQSPADVFFHVRDFDLRLGRPAVGMAVVFEEIHVGGKGPRAVAVRPAGQAAADRPGRHPRPALATPAPTGGAPSASLRLLLAGLALELALLAAGVALGRVPLIAVALGMLLNLATFWMYWHDKHAAQRRAWRVAENTLHALALAGGWPAAWWAQQLLRHKSRKPSFRQTYFACVVAHLLLLGAWVAGVGWHLPG